MFRKLENIVFWVLTGLGQCLPWQRKLRNKFMQHFTRRKAYSSDYAVLLFKNCCISKDQCCRNSTTHLSALMTTSCPRTHSTYLLLLSVTNYLILKGRQQNSKSLTIDEHKHIWHWDCNHILTDIAYPRHFSNIEETKCILGFNICFNDLTCHKAFKAFLTW